jgi:uncharacterized C2H2 Zn-finger protein
MGTADRVEPAEAYDDHVLVHCPQCDARAMIDARSGFERLTCPTCGLVKTTNASGPLHVRSLLAVYDSGNSNFGERLWLETTCCGGKRLWALNERHLDYIERFVRSRARSSEFPSPPGNRQLADELPAWMKSRKHRDEVISGITRLRSTL